MTKTSDISAYLLPTPKIKKCSKSVAGVVIKERKHNMKLVKCDFCGDLKETDETSSIMYKPSDCDECCPCYKRKNGELEPIVQRKEFDVCDKCAARILQAITRKKVVPSLLTQERETETEVNSETEFDEGDTK